ncbi:Uncharacterised protein [Bordetella pertussis]|nr:Uncharacterised protein [Bordetella pertussis]
MPKAWRGWAGASALRPCTNCRPPPPWARWACARLTKPPSPSSACAPRRSCSPTKTWPTGTAT